MNEPEPTRLLVTVEVAAAMLSVSQKTIYRAVARGELPVRKIGRAVRIPVAALHRWIEDGEKDREVDEWPTPTTTSTTAQAGCGPRLLG